MAKGGNTASNQKIQQQQATIAKQNEEIAKQNEELAELKTKLIALESKVNCLENKVGALNNRLEVNNHVNDVLNEQIDSLQQYTRRNTIILDGVPSKPKETVSDVESKVKDILIKNFKVNEKSLELEYDKSHRISKGKDKPIIIRFKSHAFRSNLYQRRKKGNNKDYKLRVSLTNKRLDLLNKGREKIEDHPDIDFIYANINGDITIRMKEELDSRYTFRINSLNDIDQILNKLEDERDGSNVIYSAIGEDLESAGM